MRLLIFSVFDVKSGAFAQPFFMPAVGMATRAFGDWSNNVETPLGKHPEDYSLYQIGHFDDGDARIVSFDTPKHVGDSSDFVEVVPKLAEVPRGRT